MLRQVTFWMIVTIKMGFLSVATCASVINMAPCAFVERKKRDWNSGTNQNTAVFNREMTIVLSAQLMTMDGATVLRVES